MTRQNLLTCQEDQEIWKNRVQEAQTRREKKLFDQSLSALINEQSLNVLINKSVLQNIISATFSNSLLARDPKIKEEYYDKVI